MEKKAIEEAAKKANGYSVMANGSEKCQAFNEGFLACAEWLQSQPVKPSIESNDAIKKALQDILTDWNERMGGDIEKENDSEYGFTYWSPSASLISSKYISAARKALSENPEPKNQEGEDEDMREPIENALYATKRFLTTQCTDLAEGILLYLKDAGYKLVKI